MKKSLKLTDNLIDFTKFSKNFNFPNKFSQLKSNVELLKKFKDRTVRSDKAIEIFFTQALSNLEKNLDEILKLVELRLEDSKNYIKNDQSVLVRQYLESQDSLVLSKS